MKKILTLLTMLVVAISMSAADVTLTFASSDFDPAISSKSASPSTGEFSICGYETYVNVCTRTGSQFVFQTNESYLSYTSATAFKQITITGGTSNAEDKTLTIYVNDTEIGTITFESNEDVQSIDIPAASQIAGAEYKIASASKTQISQIDYIDAAGSSSETITLGTNGYSTFAGESNFTVTGATAYTASLDGSTVTLSSCDAEAIIAAGKGIVLKGTEGDEVTISYTEDAATVTSTGLEGVISSTESIPAADDMYVLASNGATTAFVKAPTSVTKTQMLNKAYLAPSVGGGDALPISFGEVTAVQNVEAAPVANEAQVGQKAFVNGHLVIFTEKGYVNAIGQSVK